MFVRFHFDDDAVTATTKIFVKPPRDEVQPMFNSDAIEGYVSNPWSSQMNDLELFYLLQSLIKDEEKSVDFYHTRDTDIKEILEVRKHQKKNPLLKFSIFDPLRNESARKLRLQRVRNERLGELKLKMDEIDTRNLKLGKKKFYYFLHFLLIFFSFSRVFAVRTNENT